ncbi:MAG: hypothetical protein SV422_10630, partial [Pseudomonadota bacterium]|nr:hypothetical protein [Pseudomonadota bacterium]
FRFFPGQVTYEERGTESLAGGLTGDGVLWNAAQKRAFMTAIDTEGNNTLLVLTLWEGVIAADYPDVCAIPFMPVRGTNERRKMVVDMQDDGDAIVVTMNDETKIRIDPTAQCR